MRVPMQYLRAASPQRRNCELAKSAKAQTKALAHVSDFGRIHPSAWYIFNILTFTSQQGEQ